jgi:hypothetical protein
MSARRLWPIVVEASLIEASPRAADIHWVIACHP